MGPGEGSHPHNLGPHTHLPHKPEASWTPAQRGPCTQAAAVLPTPGGDGLCDGRPRGPLLASLSLGAASEHRPLPQLLSAWTGSEQGGEEEDARQPRRPVTLAQDPQPAPRLQGGPEHCPYPAAHTGCAPNVWKPPPRRHLNSSRGCGRLRWGSWAGPRAQGVGAGGRSPGLGRSCPRNDLSTAGGAARTRGSEATAHRHSSLPPASATERWHQAM